MILNALVKAHELETAQRLLDDIPMHHGKKVEMLSSISVAWYAKQNIVQTEQTLEQAWAYWSLISEQEPKQASYALCTLIESSFKLQKSAEMIDTNIVRVINLANRFEHSPKRLIVRLDEAKSDSLDR